MVETLRQSFMTVSLHIDLYVPVPGIKVQIISQSLLL